MEFIDSVIFLFFLLMYLSTIKSNTFFFIFGAAIYLFLLIQLFLFDPLEIILSLTNYFLFHPLGFVLLLVPITINVLYQGVKNVLDSKKRLCWYHSILFNLWIPKCIIKMPNIREIPRFIIKIAKNPNTTSINAGNNGIKM